MSGVFAIFESDGVSYKNTNRVSRASSHLGPDGSNSIVLDTVSIGHQHFYTTPEEVDEDQPIHIDNTYISFDGRIDNREHLLDRLTFECCGISGEVTDAELALVSYLEWGDRFLKRITGVFGLVIWDDRNRKLLWARDKTGIRHIYHYKNNGLVIISSGIGPILNHPNVEVCINEGIVAEYLTGRVTTPTETFYENIYKLQPGNFMSICGQKTRNESYWDIYENTYQIKGNPIDEFRSILRKCVRCRLRTVNRPGIMMSGGLDSTTLAILMHKQLCEKGETPPFAISMVFDELESIDERERIDLIQDYYEIPIFKFIGDMSWPLRQKDIYKQILDEGPLININFVTSHDTYYHSSALCNVLFSGSGGNILDGSRLYYTHLINQGAWKEIFNNMLKDEMDNSEILFWYVICQIFPRISYPVAMILESNSIDHSQYISDEFAKRTRLTDRRRNESHEFDRPELQNIYQNQFSPDVDFEKAIDVQRALRNNVELRMPFYDSRMVEFVFSLPAGTRFGEGKHKYLFRKAVKDILPEEIRTQSSNVVFDPLVKKGYLEEEYSDILDILSSPEIVERGYMEEEDIEGLLDECRDKKVDVNTLWRVVSTEMWLQHLPS